MILAIPKSTDLKSFLRRSKRVLAITTKTKRELGLTLLEVMGMVAIIAIMTGSQFSSVSLERAKAYATRSATNLLVIGSKAETLCEDTNRGCTGLVNGNVVLPVDYMRVIPIDPGVVTGAAAYTIILATNADGTKCFSLEGVASYANDAGLSFPNADGSTPTLSNTAAPFFLHYDSRSNTVYRTPANTSPIAGGC